MAGEKPKVEAPSKQATPCWFCGGAKTIAQYAYVYRCPKCGGSGLQRDADRVERAERRQERARRQAVAEERARMQRERQEW